MLGRKERLCNYCAEKGKVFSWEGFNEGDTLERMVYGKKIEGKGENIWRKEMKEGLVVDIN